MTTTPAVTTPSIAELILAEEPNLRCVARGYLFCDSDVDDLVQDTLLRAYNARARFTPGTSVRAWTTTIMRRLFLSSVMRRKRRRVQTDTDAGSPIRATTQRSSPAGEHVAPTLESLADHLDEEVKRALERVPKVHRTCFLLSAVLDLSCGEISRAMGVPRGTAMSRVYRAREQLRDELSSHRRAPGALVARAR